MCPEQENRATMPVTNVTFEMCNKLSPPTVLQLEDPLLAILG